MKMTRPALTLSAVACLLALSSCTTPQATNADTAPVEPVTTTLQSAADSIGCHAYAQSPEFAPFVTQWGTCTFEDTEVQAYEFATEEDYGSFIDSVSALGITESQLVKVGLYVFAPRDQTKTEPLRSAAG